MSTKASTQRRKVAKGAKACLRCGCTERRACNCGCCWVFGSSVCSACLTEGEYAVFAELLDVLEHSITKLLWDEEIKQQDHFRDYLNAVSRERPLPRRFTQEFQAELAELKADRKYPEIKPQYAVLHDLHDLRGIAAGVTRPTKAGRKA